jgi:protease IV
MPIRIPTLARNDRPVRGGRPSPIVDLILVRLLANWSLIWVVGLLLMVGCRQPLRVSTSSRICADKIPVEVQTNDLPVRMTGPVPVELTGKMEPMRVDMGTIPLKDESPLKAMKVAGSDSTGSKKLALVDIDGLLVNENLTGPLSAGENPVDLFREKLMEISEDGNYQGVILRINSPGGGVTACDIMRRELTQFKKRTNLPVVACLMDVGTGGAYYLASAADKIVAHPTAITGGIGVILNLYNLEDALNQFNVVGIPIKAGKNIDLGTPIRSLGEDQRDILQEIADQFHERFKETVRATRPDLSDETVFDGRILSATHAESLGLIDEVGYLQDAINATSSMAHAGSDPKVFLLHRPRDSARSIYSVTPNQPLELMSIMNIPGADRSRLPTFLYLWQPDPKLGASAGR